MKLVKVLSIMFSGAGVPPNLVPLTIWGKKAKAVSQQIVMFFPLVIK